MGLNPSCQWLLQSLDLSDKHLDLASAQLQANVWEGYGKPAKVELGTGWILNHPANSLMKEPVQRRVCRGAEELRLLQADCLICPLVLACPSVPNLRCSFLQQMVLPVSMCGDKETTGGLDSNGNTSPHLPQNTFNITPRASRTRAQRVVMRKGFKLSSCAFCTAKISAGTHCPLWDVDLQARMKSWRQSKGDRQQ